MRQSNTKRYTRCIIIVASCFCLLAGVRAAYKSTQRLRLRRPLLDAISKKDCALVKQLLDAGADANSRDLPAQSLTWQDILNAIAHPGEPSSGQAATALQLAASMQQNEIAQLLLDHGAAVNAIGEYRPKVTGMATSNVDLTTCDSALIESCANGDAKLTITLLDRGANPNLKLRGRDSSLTVTLEGQIVPVNQAGENPTPADIETIVRALLAHGAKVDGAAVTIALESNWSCVLPLLQHGGDVNTRLQYPYSRTVAIEAAAMNDAATLEYIATRHADFNAVAHGNRTALMELCHRYFGEIPKQALKTLLENGANPNLQDKQGITALMEAAGVGMKDAFTYGPDLDAIRLLLEHGASAGMKDSSGRTALQRMPPVVPGDEYGQLAREALAKGFGRQTEFANRPGQKNHLPPLPLPFASSGHGSMHPRTPVPPE